LKPTPQAQALSEPAARMLAAVQAMAHTADSAASQLAGTVRLTASEVASAQILPPLLARLAEQHPEIQVELVASNDLNNLLEREADIAVRMVRPTQGTLIARHLADWELGFYAHQSHLAGLPPVTPQNMLQQRWIGFDQSMQMIEGFRAGGFDVDRRLFHFRCDNQIVCYEAVRAGLGIGVVIVPLAERQPGLVRLLPEVPLPVLPVWLTAHRELRSSRRLRLVFDFLAQALIGWGSGSAGPAANARRKRP
jgi:DNA-binding transcriptional LysR family regulator